MDNNTSRPHSNSRLKAILFSLFYILACTVSAAIATWISSHYFQFTYTSAAALITALIMIPFFLALAPAIRGPVVGCCLVLATAMLLVTGHAVKIAAMKTPLQVADIAAIPLLLRTLSGPYLTTGIILIAVVLVLILLSIRWRWKSLGAISIAAVYVFALASSSSIWLPTVTKRLGVEHEDKPRIQAFDQKQRAEGQYSRLSALGGPLFLIEDWIVQQRDAGYVPSRDEINELGKTTWRLPTIVPTRNVHIVLLESIWDTSVLEGVSITGDAIDPRFMALWRAAGTPHALSPVIGGSTANAEFEALCGFPAPSNSIAFVGSLRNRMPCVPAVLQKFGYHTLATHPHIASNWARDTAYDRIGFRTFNTIDSFELEQKDLDGPFLTDKSMFEQNLALLDSIDHDQPVFNYIVSLSSHWAYARNMEERPDIVNVKPAELKLLQGYVNSSAYTTRAFMDWTERVLATDPDALIVVFGDHAPVLDAQPDVYKGLANQVDGHFDDSGTRQIVGMSRVPLLIVDGVNGPVSLPDDIPLYQLPQVIGNILHQSPLLPHRTVENGDIIVRSMPSRMLARIEGIWRRCGSTTDPVHENGCDNAWQIQRRNRLLRQDLAVGGSYSLDQTDAKQVLDGMEPMQINQKFKSCEFEIKQWGPNRVVAGASFNSSKPDTSAVWISFTKLRGQPDVMIGNVPTKEVRGARLITASVSTATLPQNPSQIPVQLRCPDEAPVQVGVIETY
jgi:hypothetical protein